MKTRPIIEILDLKSSLREIEKVLNSEDFPDLERYDELVRLVRQAELTLYKIGGRIER